jgi:hypothetical protein
VQCLAHTFNADSSLLQACYWEARTRLTAVIRGRQSHTDIVSDSRSVRVFTKRSTNRHMLTRLQDQ